MMEPLSWDFKCVQKTRPEGKNRLQFLRIYGKLSRL